MNTYYVKVKEAFENNSVYGADLETLRAYQQALTQQPPFRDSRNEQFGHVLRDLIEQRLQQQRHQQASAEIKSLHDQASHDAQNRHQEIQLEVTKVSADLSTVKIQLRHSHRIHVGILIIGAVTAVLALIAALDVILKWLRGQ